MVNAVAADDCPNVSLTVKVNGTAAAEVGVPETTPVFAFSERPSAGRPVALQVSVSVPIAWNVKLYTDLFSAGAAVTCVCVVVITGAGGSFTVSTNAVGADDCPNVALTVTTRLSVAFAGGVPE